MIKLKFSNILFLGPQGCGKDTQQGMLVPRIQDVVSIGMSDVFRHFIRHDPDFLGDEIERMAEGQLLTCDLTMGCLRRYVSEQVSSKHLMSKWVFNGVPRTGKQATLFRDCLPEARRLWSTAAIIFKLDPHIALKRCLDRAKKDEEKGHRRPDDTPEKIAQRLGGYFTEEGRIYNSLERSGVKCFELDARNSPEHIHGHVIDLIME